MTEILDYSSWIDILNSYNEGTACSINFRDFDLYVWLVNHQINFALNKFNGDQLQKKNDERTIFWKNLYQSTSIQKEFD